MPPVYTAKPKKKSADPPKRTGASKLGRAIPNNGPWDMAHAWPCDSSSGERQPLCDPIASRAPQV